jgi:hypothetical protein
MAFFTFLSVGTRIGKTMKAISYCKDISITDFEFDWRISQNSGVYFHIPDLTQFPDRNHKEVRLYENRLWEKPDLKKSH